MQRRELAGESTVHFLGPGCLEVAGAQSSLDVADRPGVLHAVTGVFARHEVSIRAAEQEGNGPDARLVFVTHVAKESAVQATVRELRELDVVRNIGGLLRVIG
jgi:homoserine dehydrogenase